MSVDNFPYIAFLDTNTPIIHNTRIVDIFIEPDSVPKYITRFDPVLSINAEMKFECELTREGFNELFGLDRLAGSDISNASVTFESPQQKQIKRHKKKRVNKKWNKRYGPKYMFYSKQCTLNDVTIRSSGDNIDIIGYKPYFIF